MGDGMLTTITKGAMSARIDSMGAQLMGLELEGREYLWQGDPRWWPRRAPVLFPIVGNLRGDAATSEAGPCRMKRHGIARVYEHHISKVSDSAITYELHSSPKSLEAFPFPFELRMGYRLISEGTLEQRFTVTNIGEVTLPFVVGGHPAFNVPIEDDESFGDYRIEFARRWSCSTPAFVDGGLLDYGHATKVISDSDTLPLTHGLFANDAIVLTDVPGRTVTMRGGSHGHGVQVDFDGFDYLGIWSAAGDAPFVAIEPWTGCSTTTDEDDVFEHKRGMKFLEPGDQDVESFLIKLF